MMTASHMQCPECRVLNCNVPDCQIGDIFQKCRSWPECCHTKGTLMCASIHIIIYEYLITLSVDNATFKANTAFEGGAIFSAGKNDYKTDADLAVTTISNSSFTNNTLTAADAGGAVVAGRNSKVVISNSIFDSNKVEGSKGWGGAINSYASADDSRGHSKGGMLDISDSVFTNNEAAAVGAVGIFSKANLKNLHFENNKATDLSLIHI